MEARGRAKTKIKGKNRPSRNLRCCREYFNCHGSGARTSWIRLCVRKARSSKVNINHVAVFCELKFLRSLLNKNKTKQNETKYSDNVTCYFYLSNFECYIFRIIKIKSTFSSRSNRKVILFSYEFCFSGILSMVSP